MESSLLTYFEGVAVKRLSAVEIKKDKSNQHEFNSTKELKKLLGNEKVIYKTRFLYLTENEYQHEVYESTVTWYDARVNNKERSAEFRLYYKDVPFISKLNEGDLLFFCKLKRDEALLVFAPKDSTIERQLLWLFELNVEGTSFTVKNFREKNVKVDFTRNYILEAIGFDIVLPENDFQEVLKRKFGNIFPKTEVFSEFARNTIHGLSPVESPDETLIAWMDREELLFKILEKNIISERLSSGFNIEKNGVEEFVKFSLSVHQRRKSRAGWAFDHHVAEILKSNKVKFNRQAKTEGKVKPDFLFPGSKEYRDPKFPDSLLNMLGIKTTAKDRWRQLLSEARRIKTKHLLTLEPAISSDQTNEMKENNLRLVVPKSILPTYTKSQQREMLSFFDFINYIRKSQQK